MPIISTDPIGPVLVTVGPVDPTDSLAQYADGDAEACWEDYIVENHYEGDQHRYAIPVAYPGGYSLSTQPSSNQYTPPRIGIVQLASPTLFWICDWTAKRTAKKPTIPPQRATNPNWVLLDAHIGTYHKEVVIDGVTPVWRISGTYVYVHLNPSRDVINNAEFGRPPWLQDVNSADRKNNTSLYENGISEVTTPGPGVIGPILN